MFKEILKLIIFGNNKVDEYGISFPKTTVDCKLYPYQRKFVQQMIELRKDELGKTKEYVK